MSSQPESTPAERRREKVRASILEAAETVFADEGAEGLSIRRIADAIDYSPAAIYKYFSSKDELVNELKEAFFAQILKVADDLDNHTGSFHEKSRKCLQTYIHTALSKSHHYAAAFSGVLEMPKSDEDGFFQKNKGQAFQILLNLVQEGQTLGFIRDDVHPTAAAKSLWASCHGLASLMAHMPHFERAFPSNAGKSAEEFIAFHADQVMRGLECDPQKPTKLKPTSRKRTM